MGGTGMVRNPVPLAEILIELSKLLFGAEYLPPSAYDNVADKSIHQRNKSFLYSQRSGLGCAAVTCADPWWASDACLQSWLMRRALRKRRVSTKLSKNRKTSSHISFSSHLAFGSHYQPCPRRQVHTSHPPPRIPCTVSTHHHQPEPTLPLPPVDLVITALTRYRAALSIHRWVMLINSLSSQKLVGRE